MGYMRPTEYWNPGKQSEFAERKYFREAACVRHLEQHDAEPLPEVG